MKKNSKLTKITRTALMAAIIFVVTYVVRIPIPFASGGYLNIGDTPLYIAAYLLGGPAGAVAGALGASMSDMVAGYALYALPTAVIKGAMGFVCGSLMREGGMKRFTLASVLGGAMMVGGYALFESMFFNVNQAIASVPFNCVQWAGGVIAAAALFPAVRAVEKSLG
ncbi:MAG: ECF transporter S component [Clostridiales Family XIII bacterium]|jgi:uncharacterized membrane protein|nr:ECF transporter S component [Clostridiales Family XIII bacterium]